MKVFWLNRAEALRRVRVAAQELVATRPDVQAVYVFGSLARDEAVPGSDADVLVLLDRSDRRWMDRPIEFYRYFRDCEIPVELFCYTVEEAEDHSFVNQAKAHGICLAHR